MSGNGRGVEAPSDSGILGRDAIEGQTTGDARERAAMRPKVAVDTVLFTMEGGRLKCYLLRLVAGVLAGKWAFPGGLVRVGETLEAAARRELEDATGLREV